MEEELNGLIDQLSRALRATVRDSEKIRGLLRRIEENGHDAHLTLAIVVGRKGQGADLHKIVYGTDSGNLKKASGRRISAFDRRFLRALRIQLPE